MAEPLGIIIPHKLGKEEALRAGSKNRACRSGYDGRSGALRPQY